MLSLRQIDDIYLNSLPQLIERHDAESMKLVANVMLCHNDVSSKYDVIKALSDLPVLQATLTLLLVDHSLIVRKYYQNNSELIAKVESAMKSDSVIYMLLAICTAGILKNVKIVVSQYSSLLLLDHFPYCAMDALINNACLILLRKDAASVDIGSLIVNTARVNICDTIIKQFYDFLDGSAFNWNVIMYLTNSLMGSLLINQSTALLIKVLSQTKVNNDRLLPSIDVITICVDLNITIEPKFLKGASTLYSDIYILAAYFKRGQYEQLLKRIQVDSLENIAKLLENSSYCSQALTPHQLIPSYLYTIIYKAFPERQLSNFQLEGTYRQYNLNKQAKELLISTAKEGNASEQWYYTMMGWLKHNSINCIEKLISGISAPINSHHPIDYVFSINDDLYSNHFISKLIYN